MPTTPTSSTVFEPVAGWPAVPHGIILKEATSLAIDENDHVYVVNRGNTPMVIFDRDGNFLNSWGMGDYIRTHGAHVTPEGHLLLVDDFGHTLKKTSVDGDLKLVIGTHGEYIEQHHFHRPQAISLGRGDESAIYLTETRPPEVQEGVSGLGLKIRVLDQSFRDITNFGAGTSGVGSDQFISPHSISVDSEGSVYVAEVSYTAMGSRLDPPREVTSLRKWKRVAG